jgi:GNAT superfamily N-acetyltransferase
MAIEVRRAVLGDLGSITSVHSAAALAGYRSIFPPDAAKPTPRALEPEWDRLLRDPSVSVLVAEDAEVVGCAALVPDAAVPSGWVMARLYVAPHRWADGIGTLLHDRVLLDAAERGLPRLHLWVLEANARARSMYERRGWMLVPGRTLAPFGGEPPILEVLYEFDRRSRRP